MPIHSIAVLLTHYIHNANEALLCKILRVNDRRSDIVVENK